MNKFINSKLFRDLLGDIKIIILDGGSRGELFYPFNLVNDDVLQVVKVEPDKDALVVKKSNEIICNKAIWKSSDNIKIHIAHDPSVSSIYPPNVNFISKFHDSIGAPARSTKKKITVEGQDIDSMFRTLNLPFPDFIKLDIHGCEFEALSGAVESLKNTTIGLIIESWLIEAHLGQKLAFNTDNELHKYSFYPYDVSIGRWPYKNCINLISKSQAVISESLYFKDVIHKKELLNLSQSLKLIAITELYGFTGQSLLLVEYFIAHNVLTKKDGEEIILYIIASNKKSKIKSITSKVKNKLKNFLFKDEI